MAVVQRQLEIAKADLQESQKQCDTWQQEARDCVVRYGSDDQKIIQSLRDQTRGLEESLKAAQADVQREKKVQEGLTREKTRLEKVCLVLLDFAFVPFLTSCLHYELQRFMSCCGATSTSIKVLFSVCVDLVHSNDGVGAGAGSC